MIRQQKKLSFILNSTVKTKFPSKSSGAIKVQATDSNMELPELFYHCVCIILNCILQVMTYRYRRKARNVRSNSQVPATNKLKPIVLLTANSLAYNLEFEASSDLRLGA